MDALEQEPNDDDGAERAFEALRAEVASLRRGIELLCRQGEEAKAVNYTLTLGQMMKTLEAVQARLVAIESKPALAMTAAVYRAEIGEAGRLAGEVAGRMLREGAAALSAVTRELREVSRQTRGAREQRAWLITVGAVGVIAGVGLWYAAAGLLPRSAGDWIAASLIGGGQWQAGQTLMQEASPVSFARMVKLYDTCGDQTTELCTAAIAVRTAESPGQDNRTQAGLAPARARQASRP
jgi:Family of unknown function (DUF6118)